MERRSVPFYRFYKSSDQILSLIRIDARAYGPRTKFDSWIEAVLRISLLFCALTLCAYVHALWTAGHRQDLHDNVQDLGFGFPESFVADAAQADGLRLALTRWTVREAEARAGRR